VLILLGTGLAWAAIAVAGGIVVGKSIALRDKHKPVNPLVRAVSTAEPDHDQLLARRALRELDPVFSVPRPRGHGPEEESLL
jgi:hypothetical protein